MGPGTPAPAVALAWRPAGSAAALLALLVLTPSWLPPRDPSDPRSSGLGVFSLGFHRLTPLSSSEVIFWEDPSLNTCPTGLYSTALIIHLLAGSPQLTSSRSHAV